MVQENPEKKKIDFMAVSSGRVRKEDDTSVNLADMIEAIYNALVVNKDAGVVLGGSAEIQVSAELEEGSLVGLVDGTKVGLVDGTKVDLTEGAEVELAAGSEVNIKGHTLVEQKTQADAVANVLTFAQNINAVEMFHAEETWQTFVVNGISIVVPSGGYRTPVGGVAAPTVTIPAGVNCIVGRLT